MPADFSEFYGRYEQLVREVDAVFHKVSEKYPGSIRCERGCSDCCYALFDLSLIEAMYVNHKFNELTSGEQRA
ncbi:MAG: YkgJ family cysteine cluster protein, partial [Desulfovibrionales bacterium]